MLSLAARRAIQSRPFVATAVLRPSLPSSQWLRGYARDRDRRQKQNQHQQQHQYPRRYDEAARQAPEQPQKQQQQSRHKDSVDSSQSSSVVRQGAPAGPKYPQTSEDILQDSDVLQAVKTSPQTGKQRRRWPDENTANIQPDQAKEVEDLQEPVERDEAPSKSLPDLTKGIPSTLEFEAEAQKAEVRGERSITDPIEEKAGSSSSGGRGDGGSTTAYISSLERRRQKFARNMLYVFALSLVGGSVYLGRNWDTDEEERRFADTPSGWGPMLFFNRAVRRTTSWLDWFVEPTFPSLLPDPDPEWSRPHTLVLSLQDLLIHSEWTREHGWRLAKRPGMDYFLRYLSQHYELVIWTSAPAQFAEPVLGKMDPFRIVLWRLFREATRFSGGEHIKDLSFLNRDLSKVLILDTSAGHTKAQPENAIILPKWEGDPQDKELISLIPFLEYVATIGGSDTRKVLASFKGTHIPTEYAAREEKARAKLRQQYRDERGGRPARASGVGLLGNILGIKPQSAMYEGDSPAAQSYEYGRLPQDSIRERSQKQYELIEREIRENSEKWLATMAKEEEMARQEGTKQLLSNPGGLFGLGGDSPQVPSPPSEQAGQDKK